MLAPPENNFGGGAVAVVGGRAYFSALDQGLYSVEIDGGPVKKTFPAPDGGTFAVWCRSLLATAGSLISSYGDDYTSLVVVPLDGGAIRSLATATGTIGVPFAVSSTAVYALGFNATEDAGLSHVVRTPLDGGPAQSLAIVPIDGPSGSTFQDIALASDGTLYWNTFDRILYMKVE
jgi:hypothetical protein